MFASVAARRSDRAGPGCDFPLQPVTARGRIVDAEACAVVGGRDAQGEIGLMIVLARHTGLRHGELLGLQWTDIDLKAGRLVVRRS
jgi:integrase